MKSFFLRQLLLVPLLLAVLASLMPNNVLADRLKDIASIAGVRSNALLGYGLVVGLDGTGDQTSQTPFTTQSFTNMLEQFGVTLPPGLRFQLKNVAAVAVHAELPAFAKPGQPVDVTVSSIGNAKSLRGGSLLLTSLKGADGQIYALAQGNLVVGGFGAEGADGSSITVNIPSVGRIPNGATVERMVDTGFDSATNLIFNLHRSDFTTAKRVADQINNMFGPQVARALDASSIMVTAPKTSDERVTYVSVLENLEVQQGLESAKVIINSRTGTIVVGQAVKVSPVAVTHGSLTVTVTEDPGVSQPNALAGGETAIVPDTTISIEQEDGRMFMFNAGTRLDAIVRAVNQVGAAPGDLMAILEAMKQAGALRAELVVI
ncbi:MAG: flagellar basal body P-ring protein FlgI [Gammaproteobacteria bacterium]|nr:flagellar basal body P-ring protein FlgI [Gammaproteobacteria bacterium]MBT8151259.1 flagellar basal body P-ring protein FlgI [Gammaproteobacteria bacterium]NND39053.1 flagellar basal body P-ring protein FlgI [Pseudomonadales bacterium]NNL10962.1 flagellar basal body P-ring protein FlgI [Pseudomonadales bacterium]NNM12142.1 flagellar basal body P-ring protein FlgI [Pseudomonadales bacterium]